MFNGAKVIQNEPQDSSIEFETTFKVADRLKNVGSLKILDIPFTEKVYTRNIINSEVRNYDIHYVYYENNWQYQSEILIKIGNGKKFTEIPEPKTFSFKNHRYSISFTLFDNQTLNIKREVMTTWDDISKEDYSSFKNYVNEILLTDFPNVLSKTEIESQISKSKKIISRRHRCRLPLRNQIHFD